MAVGHSIVLDSGEARANPAPLGLSDDQLLSRYIARGDEAAFEALVTRHAPRVLGVCRQILRRPHDVEDTFQATFLLLSRKAATIRKRASLGHWLHGVAHRLAVRSKQKAAWRVEAERERQAVVIAAPHFEDDPDRREVHRVLHEEIDRLPERLRQPVLLCYLEGMTNEAAARHLGCPAGTLKERLGRARETLQGRLARRGVALSAALFLLLLPRTAPAADVPRALVEATVSAAKAARKSAAGPLSLPARAGGQTRLLLLALAAVSAAGAVTVALYLTSPGRSGFLAWFLGAVRRVCH